MAIAIDNGLLLALAASNNRLLVRCSLIVVFVYKIGQRRTASTAIQTENKI